MRGIMKTHLKWTLSIAMMVFVGISFSAQKPSDLIGTWEGIQIKS